MKRISSDGSRPVRLFYHIHHQLLTPYSLGWDKNFAFIGYDDYWREHRKLFHLYFNQTVVTKYHPALLKVTKRMLVQLYENANGFMEHFRLYVFACFSCRATYDFPLRMTGSMILHVTYGLDIKSADDPLILTAEKALQSLAKYGCPGSCLGTSDDSSSFGIRPLTQHRIGCFQRTTFLSVSF